MFNLKYDFTDGMYEANFIDTKGYRHKIRMSKSDYIKNQDKSLVELYKSAGVVNNSQCKCEFCSNINGK